MSARKCNSSAKLCWSSEARALQELRVCRAMAASGDPLRREQGVYRCTACGWWHLTSRPRQVAA